MGHFAEVDLGHASRLLHHGTIHHLVGGHFVRSGGTLRAASL